MGGSFREKPTCQHFLVDKPTSCWHWCSCVSHRRRSDLWSVQSWQTYTGLHHSAGSGSEKDIVFHRSQWSVWQMWRLLAEYFCNTPVTCCQVIMTRLIKESHTAAFLSHAELLTRLAAAVLAGVIAGNPYIVSGFLITVAFITFKVHILRWFSESERLVQSCWLSEKRYIFSLLLMVLIIHLNCFDMICHLLEVLAIVICGFPPPMELQCSLELHSGADGSLEGEEDSKGRSI